MSAPAIGRARDFAAELEGAVELLRALPRRAESVAAARAAAERWAAGHPGVNAELVVDHAPGSVRPSYDLVLDHPDGGGIALTATGDDGLPWAVEHGTHWAANQVVTVDGDSLSVPAALFVLHAIGLRDERLHEKLVDHCLLLREAAGDREPLDTAELQQAADGFRRRHGLLTRQATLDWLDAIGLPAHAFERHIEVTARLARLRARIGAGRARAHLAAHGTDFDRVSAVWAVTRTPALAASLAAAADADELLARCHAILDEPAADVELTVATRRAHEVPALLRDAPTGAVVAGAVPADARAQLVGAVRRRRAAVADAETLSAAAGPAFAGWLAERRQRAEIRWHWL